MRSEAMSVRISERCNIAVSLLCYFAGAPLVAHFVFPIGLGGLLFAYPLYTITWLFGKKRGIVAAVIGVLLNSGIWFLAGSGKQVLFRSGTAYIALLLLVECIAYMTFVLIVSNMRQREDQRREEITRTTKLLHLTEMKYRNLIEIAPLPVFVVENGNLVFFNNLALEMLGYSPEELMGLPIKHILYTEDYEKAWQLYVARSFGMLRSKSITRIVRKDGKFFWVETVGQQIEWEGRPAVLYFSSDVTERKRAEEALQESEKKYRMSESKYRNLIEVAPEAISVVEKERVIFFNNHLVEMLGYSHEEMLGTEIAKIIYKDDVDEAMERYVARTEGNSIPTTTFRDVRKDGKVIWVETVGQRIDWEGRPAVLYFTSDVTERKRLEEQFAQAQKMEAIGQLAGGIAHDFNNILQVITGYCELLMGELSKENQKDVAEITKAAHRAAALTGQLLAFSRKQIFSPRVVDTKDLIGSMHKMLARVIGEDVELRSLIDPATGNFLAGPGQMEQVLLNLAVNARDAMPSGGELTIETTNRTFDETYVQDHPGAKAGQYVRIAMSDTGVGMDQETLSHIFEPFFTTKEEGKGTGLGLSTVYGIIKQSEGYINCYSEPGKGTTFTIYLPLTCAGVDKPLAAPTTTAANKGTETILLVDDDSAVRSLARVALGKAGYTVIEASGGEEALAAVLAGKISVALLVADVVMPRMSGKELADKLRKISPTARVLYISGYTENVISHHEILEEGIDFLQKPFSAAELLTAAREILDRH
jgi:two-component system, cell cycle sensor histidine kinase and response regulator CckA